MTARADRSASPRRRTSPVISLSAREVVAAGEPFRRRAETYSDPWVALDEVLSLRAAQEPLVLRVEVSGGSEAERELVAGDWLCDSDGTEPELLPDPPGSDDASSPPWLRGRAWVEAWEGSESAQWSLSSAAGVGVDRALVVAAACACAAEALQVIGDDGTREAAEAQLSAAMAWARGSAAESDVAQARAAASGAVTAARFAGRLGAVELTAASSANSAADAALYGTHFASSAADFAATALSASFDEPGSRGKARRSAHLALVVRNHVRTIDVLRAAAATSVRHVAVPWGRRP